VRGLSFSQRQTCTRAMSVARAIQRSLSLGNRRFVSNRSNPEEVEVVVALVSKSMARMVRRYVEEDCALLLWSGKIGIVRFAAFVKIIGLPVIGSCL